MPIYREKRQIRSLKRNRGSLVVIAKHSKCGVNWARSLVPRCLDFINQHIYIYIYIYIYIFNHENQLNVQLFVLLYKNMNTCPQKINLLMPNFISHKNIISK